MIFRTRYTCFKFKYINTNISLGHGRFWTQGELLMGKTLLGFWVIIAHNGLNIKFSLALH